MADEVKETKEETLTDPEALVKIEEELNEKMIADVDAVINPVEKEEVKEEKVEVKEEKKEEKPAEITEEVKEEAKEEDSKSTAEGEEKDESTPMVADLKLPNRLLQAAKRNHVSDEEILKYGENAESILNKLADASDAVSERLGVLGRKIRDNVKPAEKEAVKTATLKLPEDFDSEAGKQIMDAVASLTAEIAALKEATAAKEAQSTQMSTVEKDKKIDGIFDKVAESYPEFGKSATLSNAELVMRQNVWANADNIMIGSNANGTSITVDEALEQAMSIYEGKHPTKVKQKLVDEVTKREKQLISRPTSKKGKEKTEKGDDAAVKVVTEFLNRGKDGW